MEAFQRLCAAVRTLDRLHEILVALAAGRFGDLAVALGDLDRLMETARREGQRMVPAIERLGQILAGKNSPACGSRCTPLPRGGSSGSRPCTARP